MDNLKIILLLLLSATSCTKHTPGTGVQDIRIYLSAGQMPDSRSADPEEDLVTDMNIFIFNDRGLPEHKIYMKAGEMEKDGTRYGTDVSLLEGAVYSIYVLANAGYALDLDTEEEVSALRYYFTYPDEYRTGIPMSGKVTGYRISGETPVEIPLERDMAKISISIDRSRLDKDVQFYVNSISIGGCPRYVLPFSPSAVSSGFDTFLTGFSKDGGQVSELNEDYGAGKSGEVSLYMFENLQGELLEDAGEDSDKVLPPSDPGAVRCSYIEIKADYASDTHYTMPGDELIYRFYLGESRTNFDVRRNTHYHITVTPENDGLSDDGWRVDKSGLTSYSPYYMKVTPGTFIRGKVDESFHIRCEYYPSSASFDIGLEELEYDKSRGIYDYALDEDGNGVTLLLKGKGSGMLYMETGAPINQAEIITVIVE